eukprot:4205350-Pleurochrysis_carterae.AAC.2
MRAVRRDQAVRLLAPLVRGGVVHPPRAADNRLQIREKLAIFGQGEYKSGWRVPFKRDEQPPHASEGDGLVAGRRRWPVLHPRQMPCFQLGNLALAGSRED